MEKIIMLAVVAGIVLIALFGSLRGHLAEKAANPPVAITKTLKGSTCEREFYALPESGKYTQFQAERMVMQMKAANPSLKPVKVEACVSNIISKR